MDIQKQFYKAPVTEVVELRFETGLLQASGLGVGSENGGSQIIEGRDDGGSWGNGGWY